MLHHLMQVTAYKWKAARLEMQSNVESRRSEDTSYNLQATAYELEAILQELQG